MASHLVRSEHRARISANHYEVLGLQRTASAAEIRRAYRQLASRHHPDRAHGDAALFQRVQKAYDTLSDPAKKKHFDETGMDMSGPSVREKAMQTIGEMFWMVIADQKNEIRGHDVITFLRERVEEGRRSIPVRRAQAHATRVRIEEAKKRLKIKPGVETDVLRLALDTKIAGLVVGIKNLDMELAVGEEMLKILKDYSWTVEFSGWR